MKHAVADAGKIKNPVIKYITGFFYMAEKVRFELTVLAYTRVPGVHLKPLGHLSFMCASDGWGNRPCVRGASIYTASSFFTTENDRLF